jgi:CheY-like chemotaxis protein
MVYGDRLPFLDSLMPAQRKAPRALHILVVDDHRETADALVWLLGRLGHEAHAAYDGRGALRSVAAHPPDLIIQDIGLPHMSGYEIARRLRADSPARHVLMVAVTGYPKANTALLTQEAGFDGLLLKPLGLPVLKQLLARASARGGGHGPMKAGR